MDQQEYEQRQIDLSQNIEIARNALIYAEGSRASDRVIANRRAALDAAQAAYDDFMDGGWMEE